MPVQNTADKIKEYRIKNKQEALTKLWVKYYDGNTRTYYAYDEKNGKRVYQKGIKYLKALLNKKHEGKWERAVIYYNNKIPHDKPIHLFEGGVQIF